MNDVVITLKNEVRANVSGLIRDDIKFLYDAFGVEIENARFMPKVKMGLWDGVIRFFDGYGNTYVKLLDAIIDYIESTGRYNISVVDNRRPQPLIELQIDAHFLSDTSVIPLELRPYQVDMVNLCLSAGSGFLESCTASGKTFTCAALAKALHLYGLRTIIIVPSGDLVEQTCDTLELCGLDFGTYSGDSKVLDPPITVATWQALQYNPKILRSYDAFIVDECHTLTGQVIKDLINDHGDHIAFRYGVTGTFPPGAADKQACHASIGDILYSLPAHVLIAQGYLSTLEIEPVQIQDKKHTKVLLCNADGEFPDYDSETEFITTHIPRLEVIAEDLMRTRDKYGNTLVLVGSVDAGKALQKLIPNSVFLYGQNKTKERRIVYERFANEDGLIIIATMKIASTGISIDRIFYLALVDINKSFTRVIQAIGRGLRKKGDKSHVFVRDYFSNLKYSNKHFTNDRKKYYVEAKYPVLPKIKLTY